MSALSQQSASGRFIEEVGLMFQANGTPRIAGRVLALLIVEGRELSLQEISERLMVSKASASTSARLLAKGGVVKRAAHSGDRQDYYALSARSYFHFIEEMAKNMARDASVVEACAREIEAESSEAAARVRDFANFHHRSASFLNSWAKTLRDSDQDIDTILSGLDHGK